MVPNGIQVYERHPVPDYFRIAATIRGKASALPFSVCANAGLSEPER